MNKKLIKVKSIRGIVHKISVLKTMNIFLSVYIKKCRRSSAKLKVLMYAIKKRRQLFDILI